MSLAHETAAMEKKHYDDPPPVHYGLGDPAKERPLSAHEEDGSIVVSGQNELKRDLKGRHMQMIAMSVSPDTP
jgi:amino acid transporter